MKYRPNEKVAIAVEPYDTKEKESILSHRLPRPRNHARPADRHQQRQQAHFPRDARILFQTKSGEQIQAAEPEDVERVMSRKEREGGRIPMPGPIPAIKLKPKASDKEIEQDFQTFEYGALVVEPHTTRAGFLFYDVSQLDHPLEGSKLHLYKLRDADGHESFYFEIPFDKYVQSKSSQMK